MLSFKVSRQPLQDWCVLSGRLNFNVLSVWLLQLYWEPRFQHLHWRWLVLREPNSSRSSSDGEWSFESRLGEYWRPRSLPPHSLFPSPEWLFYSSSLEGESVFFILERKGLLEGHFKLIRNQIWIWMGSHFYRLNYCARWDRRKDMFLEKSFELFRRPFFISRLSQISHVRKWMEESECVCGWMHECV